MEEYHSYRHYTPLHTHRNDWKFKTAPCEHIRTTQDKPRKSGAPCVRTANPAVCGGVSAKVGCGNSFFPFTPFFLPQHFHFYVFFWKKVRTWFKMCTKKTGLVPVF